MYSLGNVFEQPSLKDLLYGVVVRLEGVDEEELPTALVGDLEGVALPWGAFK